MENPAVNQQNSLEHRESPEDFLLVYKADVPQTFCKCHICGKQFLNADFLSKHMLEHEIQITQLGVKLKAGQVRQEHIEKYVAVTPLQNNSNITFAKEPENKAELMNSKSKLRLMTSGKFSMYDLAKVKEEPGSFEISPKMSADSSRQENFNDSQRQDNFKENYCNQCKKYGKTIPNSKRSSEKVNVLFCNICHKKFKKKIYLTIHMQISHSDENSNLINLFKCSICNKTFKTEENLLNHKKVHNLNSSVNDNQSASVELQPDKSACSTDNSNFSGSPVPVYDASIQTGEKMEGHDHGYEMQMELQHTSTRQERCEYDGVIDSKCVDQVTNGKVQTCTIPKMSEDSDPSLSKNCNISNNKGNSRRMFNCAMCFTHFPDDTSLKLNNSTHGTEYTYLIQCPLCEKAFPDEDQLSLHRKIHLDSGLKPYLCNVCGKQLATPKSLQTHLELHSNNKIHTCDVCGKEFPVLHYLRKHKLIHNNDDSLKCDICGKQCPSKPQLRTHKMIHTGKKPFECNICSKPFRQRSHLLIHKRRHTGYRPHRCDVCGMCFITTDNLFIHQRSKHKLEYPYECDICRNRFKSSNILAKHKRSHTNLHTCNICDKRFLSSSSLIKHTVKHTGEKSFLCALCGERFTTSGGLKQHMIRHHAGIEQHMIQHHAGKEHKCDICDRKFTQASALNYHMKNHLSDKPYKCDQCDKSFVYSFQIVKHKMVHDGVRYECDVCGIKFTDSGNLRRHKKIHSVIGKPFKCDICDKAFAQELYRKIHMKRHAAKVKTKQQQDSGFEEAST